jgi:predicted Fe-S protein YdhL (DUF1289 family)
MDTAAKVSTPCTRFCKLKDGFCIGCGRSWQQIADWTQYSEKTRLEIMASLLTNEENERKRKQS